MTGLEHKYNVSRVDGRDSPGGDKEGTRYFVLDPANDRAARSALWKYTVATDDFELAADLQEWLESLPE